jgi:glycosyltransferase involved in cell wall biosynthesis
MPADSLSVTLAVSTASYQKTLAARLVSARMLRQAIDLGPALPILEPNRDGALERVESFPAYEFSKRVVWRIWRALPEKIRPRPPMTLSVWLADRLVSTRMAPCRIFHGCIGLCLFSLRTAKKQGAICLVENAACHPRLWKRVEREECRRFGANCRGGSGNQAERLLRRMDREFAECDRIVVPSLVAQQSFAEYGHKEKTVVVQTGVDADFFLPPLAARTSATFRVCYVGRVEHAKGVGYLLEAWKRLCFRDAELLLVGEVKTQMKSFLKNYANCGVRLAGFLSPREVARCYHEASLFVQPSPNEGLAQVLLEAMASGLPVVATDRTGAGECMTSGKEGLLVPARNADALAGALLWCYQHREERGKMGLAARQRIENQFTLAHYNERVMALYRSLAGSLGLK